MDPEPDLTDQKEPEEIHEEIDQTRASLTEKLETLENQVLGTVQNVTSSVEETIETVKETVQGTVEDVKETVQDTLHTVKRTFDLRYQTECHPWGMFGGSVAAGFLTGFLLGGRSHRRRSRSTRAAAPPPQGLAERAYEPAATSAAQPAPHREPGVVSQFVHQFDPEIRQVKEMAIGALMGVVRDVIKRAVPDPMRDKVSELMDSATSKLGGRPVAGPLVDPTPASDEGRIGASCRTV